MSLILPIGQHHGVILHCRKAFVELKKNVAGIYCWDRMYFGAAIVGYSEDTSHVSICPKSVLRNRNWWRTNVLQSLNLHLVPGTEND